MRRRHGSFEFPASLFRLLFFGCFRPPLCWITAEIIPIVRQVLNLPFSLDHQRRLSVSCGWNPFSVGRFDSESPLIRFRSGRHENVRNRMNFQGKWNQFNQLELDGPTKPTKPTKSVSIRGPFRPEERKENVEGGETMKPNPKSNQWTGKIPSQINNCAIERALIQNGGRRPPPLPPPAKWPFFRQFQSIFFYLPANRRRTIDF